MNKLEHTKNLADRITRITAALRNVVHREDIFLQSIELVSEHFNGAMLVYQKNNRPDHVIDRLYICGPCITGTSIFIDKNRFHVNDRFVDGANSIVVRCNEPNGILLLGEDVNLYQCEFDLGIVGAHVPPITSLAPIIVVANGISATGSRFQSASNGPIALGQCCAIAKGTIVRSHDDHAVIDLDRNEIINSPKGIAIEGYNWICEDAVILKGVTIGYGSVLAAKAVATKNCPNKSLLAGIPAKVMRHNISWQSHPYNYDTNHLKMCMQLCEEELAISRQALTHATPTVANIPTL